MLALIAFELSSTRESGPIVLRFAFPADAAGEVIAYLVLCGAPCVTRTSQPNRCLQTDARNQGSKFLPASPFRIPNTFVKRSARLARAGNAGFWKGLSALILEPANPFRRKLRTSSGTKPLCSAHCSCLPLRWLSFSTYVRLRGEVMERKEGMIDICGMDRTSACL